MQNQYTFLHLYIELSQIEIKKKKPIYNCFKKNKILGVPIVVQQVKNLT